MWFYHVLQVEGVHVICIDARHAKAALDMATNKTDANDADGLAHLAEVGFFREVRVKDFDSISARTLVAARTRLVGMEFGVTPAFGAADTMSQRPPFSSARTAMDLDATAVDEQPIRHILGTCQRTEDTFPNATLGPADDAVVERLLRPVDIRAIATKCMDDPAQHPTITDPLLTAHICRQQWSNPLPLRIRKLKQIRHLIASSKRGNES